MKLLPVCSSVVVDDNFFISFPVSFLGLTRLCNTLCAILFHDLLVLHLD